MLSFTIIVVLNIAVFTLIGRLSTPRLERMPVAKWKLSDVFANFVNGLSICAPWQPTFETVVKDRVEPGVRDRRGLRLMAVELMLSSDVDGSHGKMR